MSEAVKIEKFAPADLARLRLQLMKMRGDSWQAAALVSDFLAGRGYGVNANAVRTAASETKVLRGPHDNLQSLLETVAYIM